MNWKFWQKWREPKFKAGDRVLWQILPGGQFWPGIIASVERDGYMFAADIQPNTYHLAREKELRAAPGKSE